ncbi:54S ribosomal protein L8, mitochondrial [Neolecta irregularis DAH-3]|uniref:54S ribosomal protein L8, mitochondrial n=1 Tax=Neolecta irregularis (strain DAH-3) TaxID=1198029 RepID=A0A1U7LL79_NEOID|nr:54S ribosomal protein L8, mitochondrial [Neolecta irregularis DAH-3]|eukprot:OLL23407.1 54S ribosomal protein L8, mitochondrial [Neolecta irregularis DAH-3]
MPIKPDARRLGRTMGARSALLRNLVSSLFLHESIITTWPKAKEAQSVAEKVITLGKKGSNRGGAMAKLFDHGRTLPKVFGELAERYRERPGGYTRVLRLPPRYGDNAPQAILELVDGPRDMLYTMTAMAIARANNKGEEASAVTMHNVSKVTKYRTGGKAELMARAKEYSGMVARWATEESREFPRGGRVR